MVGGEVAAPVAGLACLTDAIGLDRRLHCIVAQQLDKVVVAKDDAIT
jgi:hypothetical protein